MALMLARRSLNTLRARHLVCVIIHALVFLRSMSFTWEFWGLKKILFTLCLSFCFDGIRERNVIET